MATLIRNQHSTASVRGFTVVQDDPASGRRGYRTNANGPIMTALGTCQNVVFVRFAALEQLTVAAISARKPTSIASLADADVESSPASMRTSALTKTRIAMPPVSRSRKPNRMVRDGDLSRSVARNATLAREFSASALHRLS